jgi:hypothetical protein
MRPKWWIWLWLIGVATPVLSATTDADDIDAFSIESEEEIDKNQLLQAAEILEAIDADQTNDYPNLSAEAQTKDTSFIHIKACKSQTPSYSKYGSSSVWNTVAWCTDNGREIAYSAASWSKEIIAAFNTYWRFLKEHNQLPQLKKDLEVVFVRDILQMIAAAGALNDESGLSPKWDETTKCLSVFQGDPFYITTIVSCLMIVNGIIRLYMHIIPLTTKHVGAIGAALGNTKSPCKSTCTSKAYIQGYAGSIVTMGLLTILPLLQEGIIPEIRPLLSVWISFQLVSASVESGSPDDCWTHVNKRIEGSAIKITTTAFVLTQLPLPVQIISTLFIAGSTRLKTSFAHSGLAVSPPNRLCYQLVAFPRVAIEWLLTPATRAVKANIFDTDITRLPKRIVSTINRALHQHEHLSVGNKHWYTQLMIWTLIPPELLHSDAFARDPILSEAFLSILPGQKPEKIEKYIRLLLTLREFFLGQIALDVMSNPVMQAKGEILTKQPAWLINWAHLLLTDETSIADIKNILDRREGLENLIATIQAHQGNVNPTLDTSDNNTLQAALKEELSTILDEHQENPIPTLGLVDLSTLENALAEEIKKEP